MIDGQLIVEQGSTPGPGAQPRPIRPTVFVGLGGTGLKVLARFRQRLFQQHGDPDYWPIYRFLGVDTDEDDLAKGGVGDQKGVALREDDLMYIGMQREAVSNVTKNLSPGGSFGYMGKWLPSKNYDEMDLTKGAKQARSIGRLLFAYHVTNKPAGTRGHETIRQEIKVRCEQAMSETAIKTAVKNGANMGNAAPRVDVVIVASIAGGTGAGSFMDCAFLVKSLFRQNEISLGDVRGMLVLPDVFVGLDPKERSRVFANSYAALRELEHFNGLGKGNAVHPRDWGRPNDDAIAYQPFDTCYLFSRSNTMPLENPDELFDMIADALAFSVGGTALAAKMRSCWSNAQSQYEKKLRFVIGADFDNGGPEDIARRGPAAGNAAVMYERTWATRFSSLGISSVTLKLPEVRRLAAVRYIRRIIDFEVGAVPEKNPATLARVHAAGDGVLNRKDLLQEFDKKIKDMARAIVDRPEQDGDGAAREIEALLRDLRDVAQGVAVPGTSDRPLVQKLLGYAADQGKLAAGAVYRELQRGDHQTTLYMLDEVATHVKRALPQVGELEEFKVDCVQLKQWKDLDSHGGGDLLGLEERALRIIRKNLRSWLDGQCDALLQRMNRCLQRHYIGQAVHVLGESRGQVQRDVQDLHGWGGKLAEMQDKLAKTFEESRNEVLSVNLGAPAGDKNREPQLDAETDRALTREFGGAPRQQLEAVRRRLLDFIGTAEGVRVESLLQTIRQLERVKRGTVERVVQHLAYTLLRDLPRERDIFARMAANEQDPASAALPALSNVVNRARPYWPVNPAKPEYEQTVNRTRLWGAVVPTVQSPIQGDVTKFLNDRKYNAMLAAPTEVGAPEGELVVVEEGHGYSLTSLHTLLTMKNEYDACVAAAEGLDRHLDKRTYARLPELVLPDPSQAQDEAMTWDIALFGIVLGRFRWNDERRQFQYTPDTFQQLDVGDSYSAIAKWLNSFDGAQYYEPISKWLQDWFDARIELPLNSTEGEERQRELALEQAQKLMALSLVLDLLGTYCFPATRLNNQRYQPPDHTMIVRMQRNRVRGYWVALHNHFPALADEAAMRADLAARLHQIVRFVGPHTEGTVAGSGDEARLVRSRRVLQLVGRKAPDDGRAVLNEVFRLGWFDPPYRVALEVKSLFPSDRATPADDGEWDLGGSGGGNGSRANGDATSARVSTDANGRAAEGDGGF